ncbi:hypothetical protein HKD37_16G045552 [Glycine soja]
MKVQAEGGGLFRYESAANMLEGGGKTLILNPMELEEIGFKIVVYLFSLIGLYSVDSKEMESSIIDDSTASRKCKRDEEEEEELEQTFFIIVNVTTMILGALTCSNFVQAFWSSPHGNNVKNHFKLWRTWYGIVSDILSQSGFDWDSTKYMITIENEIAWNEYVKSHEEAKQFRFKVIPNWNDIVDLCAKDRATGLGAENALDADDIMSKETNEEETIHTVSFYLIKFRHKKKHLPKAIDWLTENPIKFAIIKALPLDEKEDYISSFMP